MVAYRWPRRAASASAACLGSSSVLLLHLAVVGGLPRETSARLLLQHRAEDEPQLEASSFDTSLIDSYAAASAAAGYRADADLPPLNATAEASLPHHTLVVAKYDEDDTWLQHLPKNIDVVVYQSKHQDAPNFVENLGNEASKYLSYIVEHYESLPSTMAFAHAGQQDWHDPVPKDHLLRSWQWERAEHQGGYVSLPTSAPCLVEDRDPPESSESPEEVAASSSSSSFSFSQVVAAERRGRAEPLAGVTGQGDCQAVQEHWPKQMPAVREAWSTRFEGELGPLPARWATHCCAQFEVTREAVRRHPLEFYQSLLAWTLEHDRALLQGESGGDMKRNHDPARRDAGHLMELLWVLVFSPPQA